MTAPTDRRRSDATALLAAWRVARRAASDHLRPEGCQECDANWRCPEGQRLWLLAEGLESRLPWNAFSLANPMPAPEPDPREAAVFADDGDDWRTPWRGMVLAFALGVAILSVYPLYLWIWR